MRDSFKVALRRSRLQVREQLSLEYQNTASSKVCNRISSLEEYRKSKRIALYQAIGGEISLNNLWNSAPLQGKFCYFPVLGENKSLLFLPATPSTPFKLNRFGIKEPDIDISEAISPEYIDIIFMPLVVFDEYGTRVGMGAGYYDRTLAQVAHQRLIGVAYEFQYYPYIEPQSWDIPMAGVVTPQRILWRKKRQS
ncbi:MAG: 5-formyltetrahydrofolate cyclo-ligase [Tatlockia sp.]|nr:5-formyltetrahydrofolate cyclo-ligase [Tatlockia sp.]